MQWIVFGDDWGAHPSTTQHLVRHLPASDRVVWVDSIGMRSPGLNRKDLARLVSKATSIVRGAGQTPASAARSEVMPTTFHRVVPRVLPFHRNRYARALNRRALGRALRVAVGAQAREAVTLLTATPVAVWYLDAIPHTRLAYLRLDDYAALPGVDASLVREAEAAMFERCDVVLATARELLPGAPWNAKGRYLPQGVDNRHFGRNRLDPPGDQVIGFFGLIAEWLDFALIEDVARSAPAWRFEFIGPVRHLPDHLRALPNVHWLGPVDYADLPAAIAGWTCAWIPFLVNDLTKAVNPLKLREYLAAGLPAHVTPLPEARSFSDIPGVLVSASPQAIRDWMERVRQADSPADREARRARVAYEGWDARAVEMRQMVAG